MKIKTFLFLSVISLMSFASLQSCDDDDKALTEVPAAIQEYVTANYPDAQIVIVKYDKRDKDYEVQLSNGWELTFNKKFQLIDADI